MRPLCVFDGNRLDYHAKVTGSMSWNDLPTCMSFGIPVQYLMLRGIFTTPEATPDHSGLTTCNCWPRCAHCRSGRSSWRKARSSKRPSADGRSSTGSSALKLHRVLMREAKFMAPNANTLAVAPPPGATATAKK